MAVYVALLRGINIGKRQIKMTELAETVRQAGGEDVSTYIQSGNLVLRHRARSGAVVERELEKAISTAAGFHVPVIVRSAKELGALIAANPFDASDPTKLHVVFHPSGPTAAAMAKIDAPAFAPEEMSLRGKDLYLYLPGGMGRSQLAHAIGVLGKGTARNWRTVLKLYDMASEIS